MHSNYANHISSSGGSNHSLLGNNSNHNHSDNSSQCSGEAYTVAGGGGGLNYSSIGANVGLFGGSGHAVGSTTPGATAVNDFNLGSNGFMAATYANVPTSNVNSTTMLTNYCDAAMMMAAAAVNANQCFQQHHRLLMTSNDIDMSATPYTVGGNATNQLTASSAASTSSMSSASSTLSTTPSVGGGVTIAGQPMQQSQQPELPSPPNLIDISEVPLIVDVK